MLWAMIDKLTPLLKHTKEAALRKIEATRYFLRRPKTRLEGLYALERGVYYFAKATTSPAQRITASIQDDPTNKQQLVLKCNDTYLTVGDTLCALRLYNGTVWDSLTATKVTHDTKVTYATDYAGHPFKTDVSKPHLGSKQVRTYARRIFADITTIINNVDIDLLLADSSAQQFTEEQDVGRRRKRRDTPSLQSSGSSPKRTLMSAVNRTQPPI